MALYASQFKKAITIVVVSAIAFSQVQIGAVLASAEGSAQNKTETTAAEQARSGDTHADFSMEAQKATIESGQLANFNLYLKISGKDTVYNNVDIVITLPGNLSENLVFDKTSLSDMTLNGVTPTYDETSGKLTYHYDQIKGGTSDKTVLKIDTNNGATLPGETLKVQGTFTGTNGEGAVENYSGNSEVSIAANNNLGITNKQTSIEGTKNESPDKGDIVNYSVGVSAPKKSSGSLYVKEGTVVKVTYRLDKNFEYVGIKETDAKQPTVVGNTLTWEYTAPSYAEQKATKGNFFEKDLTVQAKVKDSAVYYDKNGLINIASASAEFIDGSSSATQPVNSKTYVIPNNPDDAPAPLKGSNFPTNHKAPADGNGNVASAKEGDKDIQVSDDAYLGFGLDLTPASAGSATIGFNYYNLVYKIDSHLNFENFWTGTPYYMPNSSLPTYMPQKKTPVYAFNVKYMNDNGQEDANWTTLKMSMDPGKTYTKKQLGIPEGKKVSQIWLWFHRADYTKVPATPAEANNFNYIDDNGDRIMDMAPAGIYEYDMRVNTTVEKGYLGQVANHMDLTFYGYDWEGYMRDVSYDPSNTWSDEFPGSDANNVTWRERVADRHVEITKPDEGKNKLVQGTVAFENQVGNMTNTGENTVLTTVKNNKASSAALTGPFVNYVLLPTGVKFKASVDPKNAIATVVDENYQGTGRQLIKVAMTTEIITANKYAYGEFTVDIEKNAPNNLDLKLTGTTGDEKYIAPDPSSSTPLLTDTIVESDKDDINGDGNIEQLVFKSGNAYVLNKGEHLSVNTTVKGDKDSKNGQMANVTTAEKANYRLTLDNDTDDKVTSLNILNVLPTVGDSNVLDGEARNSAYVMKMTKAITLPKAWQDKVDVYYTTSANPKRTGTIDVDTTYPTGATKVIDPVGAEEATWVNADQVKDWSTIHAFKIVMKDGVEWVQGKGL